VRVKNNILKYFDIKLSMFQYCNKIGFKFSFLCPFHFSEAKKNTVDGNGSAILYHRFFVALQPNVVNSFWSKYLPVRWGACHLPMLNAIQPRICDRKHVTFARIEEDEKGEHLMHGLPIGIYSLYFLWQPPCTLHSIKIT